jgi:hypothetical protein
MGGIVGAFVLLLSGLLWLRYRTQRSTNRYLIDLTDLADEGGLDLEVRLEERRCALTLLRDYYDDHR